MLPQKRMFSLLKKFKTHPIGEAMSNWKTTWKKNATPVFNFRELSPKKAFRTDCWQKSCVTKSPRLSINDSCILGSTVVVSLIETSAVLSSFGANMFMTSAGLVVRKAAHMQGNFGPAIVTPVVKISGKMQLESLFL